MPEKSRTPRHARPLRWTLGALLCLALAAPGKCAESASDSMDIEELNDPALIHRVWKTIYPDSVLPRGEYQVLVPHSLDPAVSGPNGTVFLLRDGTEAGRLPLETWQRLSANAAAKNPGWMKWAWDTPDAKEAPPLWRAFDANWETWLNRAEWPAGLQVGVGSALSAVPHSSMQFERQIDFDWTQKVFTHFLLGAAVHRTQFGGGLTRIADEQAAGPFAPEPAFWSTPYWWYSFSAGVPALRYTTYLADQPLPRYFWLETAADSLILNRRPGKVVTQWTGRSLGLAGNWAHRLDARLAYFRYGLNWDGDAYASPVQTFGLDDVPAFFGSWGAGVIYTPAAAATRVWVDIPDLVFSLPHPQPYPSDFRVAFLRLDFAYRSLRSFSLGLSVTVKLNNPIFNLPGAKS